MKLMMRFHGEFRKKLDSGNRIVIPARFLNALGDDPELVCYVHVKEKCIRFYEYSDFDNIIEEAFYQASDVDNSTIKRYIYMNSYSVKPDSRNRVIIPRKFLKKTGIHDDVVLVGLGSRFELWDMDTYLEMLSPVDDIEVLEMPF